MGEEVIQTNGKSLNVVKLQILLPGEAAPIHQLEQLSRQINS